VLRALAEILTARSAMISTVDLTNCDREPIHIPGWVQPHAVMLVLEEPELRIVQVSANTHQKLGVAPDDLLGRSLSMLLPAGEVENLRTQVLCKSLEAAPYYLPPLKIHRVDAAFEAVVHRYEGALILELETKSESEAMPQEQIYASLKHTLSEIQAATTVKDFCQVAAERLRDFIGFDRVMVYRFSEDGSGHVLAEALREDLESYLGLHYPAADIPKQARELFKKSQLRLIPDVGFEPVALKPVLRPGTGAPLDMSYCVTRATSPIHAEYLQNMGVRASMSVSIVIADKLWGLFACHHYSPRYVPHATRMACEFLAHTLSLQVDGKEKAEQHGYVARLREAHQRLVEAMLSADDFRSSLLASPGKTFIGIDADGAAFVYKDEIHVRGDAGEETDVQRLVAWLTDNVTEPVWTTDRLGELAPELADTHIGGVLAARLSSQRPDFLLWLRLEEARTVNWAGDPTKAVVATGPNGDRLTPRKSFALWSEKVRGRSLAWRPAEVSAARLLRHTLLEWMVRRAEQLERLNLELREKNSQLDAFAYVASHDLKEPLRGIHNFAGFLLEDHGKTLDAEATAHVRTVLRLSERMESLLDSLLYYSRLSRTEFAPAEIDMDQALTDAIDLSMSRLREYGVQVRRPRPLPRARADFDRMSEVFANLIANAIKYNDKAERWVEIGHRDAAATEPVVYYVRDNGIGIAEEHRDLVFRIFKRLHERDKFGGGVGAGLTIVRKIVERHDGRIWVESTPGAGTTFCFTLNSGGAA
jgi:two-component system, chemotaxis family, sensor kinase Cph1